MVLTRPWLCVLASVAGCSTAVRTSAPAPACLADCAAQAKADASGPASDQEPAPDVPDATSTTASSELSPLFSPRFGTGSAVGSLSGSAISLGLGGRPRATPRVTVGVPTVGPAFPTAVVRRVIFRRHMSLRLCYQRALATKPTLAGRVQVRFVIDPTGVVSKAVVTTGLDPAVDACLVDVLRAIRFPAPSGGAAIIVTFPFTFAPSTGP